MEPKKCDCCSKIAMYRKESELRCLRHVDLSEEWEMILWTARNGKTPDVDTLCTGCEE